MDPPSISPSCYGGTNQHGVICGQSTVNNGEYDGYYMVNDGYSSTGWWLVSTPLKNDGVKVSRGYYSIPN